MKKTTIYLFLTLLAGAGIRLWNFTASGLWHDEAFSALLIQMPFQEMMHRIALDVHPPLYYWLLSVWSDFFGLSLSSLRGFSVFFGVLSVWGIYMLVKELTNKRYVSLAAAGLLAMNTFHIQYSFEARMYTLGTFLVIFGSWMLLKAIKSNKRKYWLIFALTTTAGALTHYFVLFSLAAQGLFVLIWWLKNLYQSADKAVFLKTLSNWRWFFAYIFSLILYSWWLPTFWRQLTQVQENYWIPEMNIWSIPSTIWKIFLGGFQGAENSVLIISSITVLVILGVYVYRYGNKYKNWLIVFMSAVPFVLAVLASLQTSVFLDRYFIFTSVFITAMLGMAIWNKKYKSLSMALVILLMFTSVISYVKAWKTLDVDNNPGMTAAAEYLDNRFDENDKILVSSTFIYFSHRYYFNLENPDSPVHPQLYLKGIENVKQLPHFSGTALLENKDFVPSLDRFAEPGQTVWLLWTTGFGGNKPNDIPVNWTEQSEMKFGDIFPHRGDIFVTEYEIQ